MRTTDRALAIDAAAIAAISAGICLASHRPVVMAALVLTVIGARFVAWRRLPAAQRGHGLGAELAWFGTGLVLGAANDWNSVTRHRIYDYTVPVEWPALSLVPIWMLLAWGMIVRLAVGVVTWQRLALPAPRALSPWLALPLLLGLVVATRQAIYRTYADPLWSWLPFALALALAIAILRPDRRRLALLAGVAAVGPAVEVLYIQVGRLHAYPLGWLGGVPLWIVLWWVLAVLVLEQLVARVPARVARGVASRREDGPRGRSLQP